MELPSGVEIGVRHSDSVASAVDEVVLRSALAWGDDSRFWDRFEPSWQARLLMDRGGEAASSALEALRTEHAAQARPDPNRIHPSWTVRALARESSAVRFVVAASSPLSLGAANVPHPDIVACVWALWSERLVGDLPERPHDSPVVRTLTGPDRENRNRLVALIGLAKRAYLPEPLERTSWSASVSKPFANLQRAWGDERWSHLLDQAKADVAAATDAGGLDLPRLGLETIARLLGLVEPRRARWVLQHIPYDAANYLRRRMQAIPSIVENLRLLEWEEHTLALARTQMAASLSRGGQA